MVKDYLQAEFKKRCDGNPSYSLRSFAKSLDINSSTLSQILNGKRNLTLDSANRLLQHLDIDSQEKTSLLFAMSEDRRSIASDERTLREDEMILVEGWEHYALLSLLRIENLHKTTGVLADRLGISIGIVPDAMSRLERLGLVKKEGTRWKLLQNNVSTTSDIPNDALRRANKSYIHKALESLDLWTIKERDVTGITMAVDSRRLEKAKTMIAQFRRSLCEYLEGGKPDRVFRLNVQLFPVSKITRKNGGDS